MLSSDDDYPRGQKLIIKQILLGAEAKDDEFNVVEVSNNCRGFLVNLYFIMIWNLK